VARAQGLVSNQVTPTQGRITVSGWPMRSRGIPVLVGLMAGAMQVALSIVFWWLSAATVQGLFLPMIAAVYVGFAVADGRPRVIGVEVAVAPAFVLIGAVSLVGPAWLLVAGYFGHGLKDLWQERQQFVANTRWWPSFCLAVDWLVAAAPCDRDRRRGQSPCVDQPRSPGQIKVGNIRD
jgi:hypothetical protein